MAPDLTGCGSGPFFYSPRRTRFQENDVKEEKQFANAQYGKLLEAAKAKAKEAGIELKALMRPGHPALTIVAVAQEGKFDLVLVGHTGLSGVWAASWAPPRKR